MGWMVGRTAGWRSAGVGGAGGWVCVGGGRGVRGREAECVGVRREHWKASRGGLKSDRGV